MKNLLPILTLFLALGCDSNKTDQSSKSTAPNSPTAQMSPTAKPNIEAKMNRENFVNLEKPDMRRSNLDISYAGAESNIIRILTNDPVNTALQSLKPSFGRFRELGFKTLELRARDGRQTINLEVSDNQK